MFQKWKQNLRYSWINLWWALRLRLWHLSAWQFAYLYALSFLRPDLYEKSVHSDTDVVIEGFPRSANTFLVHAFEMAVSGKLKVAHHFHDPCQIGLAIRSQIPCFVIIRNPLDAIVSWKLKAPNIDVRLMLRIYDSFYRYAFEKEQVIFLRYSDVVGYTPKIVRAILQHSEPSLQADLASLTEERIFHSIDNHKRAREGKHSGNFDLTVARPTKEKEDLKRTLRSDISTQEKVLLSEVSLFYKNILSRCLDLEQDIGVDKENV